MINGKRIVVVMPAYQAGHTLEQTYAEVRAQGCVDRIIIVDDASPDHTAAVAGTLDARVVVHKKNVGYGGNQKTCYATALEEEADVVVMVHADAQYTPRLIPAMAGLVASGLFDCVLGSRILGGTALAGGMPRIKYVVNRLLTALQNLLMGSKLSEFHTGYRAFSKALLQEMPLDLFSDNFVFDNQMLSRIIWEGWAVGEVSCPTKYFKEASSIGWLAGSRYAAGCLLTAGTFALARMHLPTGKLLFPHCKRMTKHTSNQP